jgi:hypothetical protein
VTVPVTFADHVVVPVTVRTLVLVDVAVQVAVRLTKADVLDAVALPEKVADWVVGSVPVALPVPLEVAVAVPVTEAIEVDVTNPMPLTP